MQRQRKCFVPMCANNSTNNPDKLFVRVREDLKKAWCRDVNAPYYPIYLQYCCEDHLNLQEDLKNYYKRMITGEEPKLKPTAKLRIIPIPLTSNTNNLTTGNENESSAMVISEDSELMKHLLRPVDNSENIKKRKLDDTIIPSTSASTLPTKVHAAVQCKVKMVDKSTNYRARARARNVTKSEELKPSPPEITTSSPSLFGATSEAETSTVDENEQGSKKEYAVRMNLLQLVQKKTNMYLGLPLKFIWLLDNIVSKSSIKTTHLSLVLTLFKLKQNDSLERMSMEFEISRARISSMFAQGVEVLANFFQNLIYMPSPLQIKKNLPLVFKIRYSNVQMIIDCFEIQIEKPSDPVKQAQTWSQYKNCNTIKYLIGSTPNGFINFVSTGYGGRISDKALVMESQLLDVLPHNAVVLADRGFKEVESLFMSKGVKLLRPPSVYTGQKPTKEEVIQSKTIASLRVHIERVIRRIREFRLLKPHSVVNCRHVAYLDELVIIACGLINLQGEIIKKY